ncbi:filamentous hemagglutinin N-terminal domain-containing protein [Candidatus Synechococcus calcipolaris G9]|uniref:Filamentous hemagglutinin N-terminal domain-containing protein n=1 Tax=Candidatus Synechococcus calcipolaris G9 TaxID=1497997 RepID=A0ABT6EXE3_9SYNE|nr:filamentous hemagglutinin N-terminal domain-containing protein [Candidatus Synechococcus calcipolaris]MDG2989778.1 filamentous hemagglutinin N-terminal domain-containing protein [Candidatus Synechococcus calcipolaris G9]
MFNIIRRWFAPLAVLGCLLPLPAIAQITPAVGGTGTTVTVNGQQFDIGGGAFSRDGKNLFHLFKQFGLSDGQIANFLSNSKVQNILAGVNGGDVSYINGLIQVTGGNSNLYLLNPAGIVFGPNAQLNVPAAFHASTAHRVHFDGGVFDINGFNDYANLVGNPTGFEFLSTGIIVNEGNLAVGPAQNLTLMGHQVFNTGTLSAPGGRITIQAVPETGMVRISQEGMILSLEIPADRIPEDGVIEAVDLPRLITGGTDRPRVNSVVHNPDGSISLVHDPSKVNMPVEGATTVASGTMDVSSPEGVGGQINVLGSNVAFVNAQLNASGGAGGGTILGGGDYLGDSAGTGRLDSSFNAQHLYVDNNTVMNADAVTQGQGGTVINWADNSTIFHGFISAQGGILGGDGGFAEVSGRERLVYDGMTDLRATLGQTGTLLLDPKNISIEPSGPPSSVTNLLFANNPADDVTITIFSLANALTTASVTLQANNDIISIDPNNGYTFLNPANGTLTLQAGRSINFNISFSQPNLNIVLVANESNANGVIAANRDNGPAFITFGSTILPSAISSLTATISTGDGRTGTAAETGNITLNRITAPNGITATNNGLTAGSSVIVNSPLSSTTGPVVLNSTHDIAINNTINTGENVTLNAGGSVTQNGTGVITANGLELLGAGTFTLTNAGNNITTLAGNTTGAISFRDADGFAIGTVNTTGLTSTGNITLNAAGNVTQNGTGVITANGLELLGAGTFTLTNTSNNITTLASNTTGAISYTDADSFTVGTVNTTRGIRTPGNVTLTAGGTINVIAGATNSPFEAIGPSNIVTLDAGEDIILGTQPFTNQYGDITASQIILNADRDITVQNTTWLTATGANGFQATAGRNFNLINPSPVNPSRVRATAANAPLTITTGAAGKITLNSNTTGAIQAGSGGTITLNTNELDLLSGTVQSTNGQLFIQPVTASTTIGIGDGAMGTLNLDTAEINRLGDGFSQITIGSATGSGNIDIRTAAFQDNVLIRTPTGTGTINLNGNLSTGNTTETAGSITLQAGQNIIGNSGSSITTTNQNVLLDADRSIALTSSNISTGNGSITLNANQGATPASGNFVGINLNNANLTTTGGNINLSGRGGNIGSGNRGISQTGGSQVISSSGSITYLGKGGTVGTGSERNHGIYFGNGVANTTTLIESGSGQISLTGQGGMGDNGRNHGVYHESNTDATNSNAITRTTTGNIIYSGTSGTGGSSNYGIFLTGKGATITSTSGTVDLTGHSQATGGANNFGILQQWGGQIISGGNISVTGSSANNDPGIFTSGGTSGAGDFLQGVIRGTSTNSITLTADRQNLDWMQLETTGNGTLLIRPLDPATSIGIGNGATGTLNLSNTALSKIQDGFSLITIGSENGTGLIEVAGTVHPFNDNLQLRNSSGGIQINSALNVGANNLTLNSGGTVTQTAPIIAQGVAITGSGDTTLDHPNNQIQTIAANTTGNITVVTGTDLAVDTVNPDGIENSQTVVLQSTTGNITLNQPINATQDITLAADQNFINNAGVNALIAGGRWLVYATSPEGNINGWSVLGGSQQFSTTYPAPSGFAGNGFVYSVAAPPLPPVTSSPVILSTAPTINIPAVPSPPSSPAPPMAPTSSSSGSAPPIIFTPVDLPLPSNLSTILQGQEEEEMPLEQSLCQLLEEGEETVLEINGVPVESVLAEQCR